MRRVRILTKHLVAVLALALLPLPALAAIYNVPGDFPTILDAIRGVEDGSTIFVAPGVYHEFILARSVNKDLYILATGGPANTAIDGQGTDKLLQVNNTATGDPGKNLVFDGFTFRNGKGDATSSPVTVWGSRPTFLNCVFSDNVSTTWGGAVVVNGAEASPSFVNCVFRNNRTLTTLGGRGGGAVLVAGDHARASFKGCLFENNTANAGAYTEGGAIYFSTADGVVQDSVFLGNATDYAGGAIMILSPFGESSSTVTIRGSRFEGNSGAVHSASRPPPSEGGAIMAEGNVNVTITGSFFAGNSAESGGAIQSYRANLTVADSVFDGNTANGTSHLGSGGAICVSQDDAGDADRREGAVDIRRTMFRNNVAPTGGALSFAGDYSHGKAGTVTLADVTVDAALATTAGSSDGNAGAIMLNLTSLAGTRVYLLRNTAQGLGGAVALVNGSSLSLTDSFVAGNSALVDPGIHNPGSLPVTLTRTVVAHNDGEGSGTGALLAATPTVTVDGKAHLAYFVAPYPSGQLQLEPVGLGLPNEQPAGDPYAAGSAVVTGVLASETYSLSSAPGATAAVTYTANGLTDTWFAALPHPVPGVVEAEEYDRGGDRVGYHDRSAANDGGDPYRPGDGVDIFTDALASNGRIVGLLDPGEWMDFTVAADADALFDLWAGVIAGPAGGEFYVQVDGEDVTGRFTVPDTGGTTPAARTLVQGDGILLSRGQHLVRVIVVRGGFSLDYLEWTVAGTKSLLSLGASPAVVGPGETAVLTGVLTGWPQGGAPSPLAGVFLTLEYRVGAATDWTELTLVETAPDGSFSASHDPASSTTYRARWSGGLLGPDDYPAVEASAAVGLAPLLTVEVRGYRGLRRGYYLYNLGNRVRMLGTISPEQYPGEVRIRIERRTKLGWIKAALRTRPLTVANGYRWRWRPKLTGRYRVSTSFAGDADAAAAQSAYGYFRVR